jgi:pseudaminic acid cytidylyltransferase
MKLAVIPARGGSRRIPRKNIRSFFGQPMIAWSLQAAQAANCFDRIIVSTDDPEIARIAQQHGAETPFTRPAALSDDHAGTAAVIAHAIEFLHARGTRPDWVCCLYATAPFVSADDLAAGYRLIAEADAEFCFPVTRYAYPIQRALRITAGRRCEMLQPGTAATRSQDLQEAWHDAGQFYWGKPAAWLTREAILSGDCVPLPIPRYRVQDLDTEEDWINAELMFEALRKRRQ